MPEALLNGHLEGEQFDIRLGYRMPAGCEAFLRYYDNAIGLDGPEITALAELSTRTGAALVLSVTERAGSSLFRTAIHRTGLGSGRQASQADAAGTERLI